MTCRIVLNDHPYVSERNYNGLRLATALASNDHNVVRIFLIVHETGRAIEVSPKKCTCRFGPPGCPSS